MMLFVTLRGRLVTNSGPLVTKEKTGATSPTIFIVRDY